jgi:hypothetical protein
MDRPPAAQLLYQLGLKDDSSFTTCPPDGPIDVAHYPSISDPFSALPNTAPERMHHLPLRLSPEPHHPNMATHSIAWSPHSGTCMAPNDNNTTTSLLYGVSTADIAQVYMSLTPYNDASEEELDLRKVDFSKHLTAGMTFFPQDNRLILISMALSTPGARVPCWRTRLRSAWLLSVNGHPVQILTNVHKAFDDLSLNPQPSCTILFAHPQIPHVISNKGLPILR